MLFLQPYFHSVVCDTYNRAPNGLQSSDYVKNMGMVTSGFYASLRWYGSEIAIVAWESKSVPRTYLKDQNMRYPYAIKAAKDVPKWALFNETSLPHLVILVFCPAILEQHSLLLDRIFDKKTF